MGEKTCAPCKLGYTKELAGGENDFCTECKKSRWTLVTGTVSGCISELLFCDTHNAHTHLATVQIFACKKGYVVL